MRLGWVPRGAPENEYRAPGVWEAVEVDLAILDPYTHEGSGEAPSGWRVFLGQSCDAAVCSGHLSLAVPLPHCSGGRGASGSLLEEVHAIGA